MARFRKLDWLGRLAYIDAHDANQALLAHPLIAGAPLLEEMHLLTPDGTRCYHGFAAFRWLAWKLPLLWLLAPLLYLPGIPGLGQRMYLWIARRRYRLVPCRDGACDIQRIKEEV